MNHFNTGGPIGIEGCVYILTNPSFIEDWVKKAVVLNELPNLSISVMIPVEATNLTGEIEKKWKSNRIDVIKKKMQNTDITEIGLPLPCCQMSTSELPLQPTSFRDKSMECQPLLGITITYNRQP